MLWIVGVISSLASAQHISHSGCRGWSASLFLQPSEVRWPSGIPAVCRVSLWISITQGCKRQSYGYMLHLPLIEVKLCVDKPQTEIFQQHFCACVIRTVNLLISLLCCQWFQQHPLGGGSGVWWWCWWWWQGGVPAHGCMLSSRHRVENWRGWGCVRRSSVRTLPRACRPPQTPLAFTPAATEAEVKNRGSLVTLHVMASRFLRGDTHRKQTNGTRMFNPHVCSFL